MKISGFTLAILIALLVLSACRPEPLNPQEAQVLILEPSAESTTTESSVEIRTFVENFTIADKIGQNNMFGEGHLIYYLDVEPPMQQGKTAATAEGTYAATTEKSYTWENLAAGDHIMWVQLVNNDNTPLLPVAAVRVYLTVK